MRVLVTGSSGRIGHAVVERLRPGHEVLGLDRVPGPGTQLVGDIGDTALLHRALRGVHAVVHTAALHAPHVGIAGDAEFERVNVAATVQLARRAAEHGVRHIVFTSSTALYGGAPPGAPALWVDENTPPRPRTVYHTSKLRAEAALEALAAAGGPGVTVLRMSRCFAEPLPLMAAYRLHRGVDAVDVADAHARALQTGGTGWRRYVISARTPFRHEDLAALGSDAPTVLARRAPALVAAFRARSWPLPARIDRVYVSARAEAELGWTPRFGADALLHDAASFPAVHGGPAPAAPECGR